MRTVIAMLSAIAAAAFVTFSVSHNVADNITATTRFDTPQAAANFHAGVFLATSLLGLIAGWIAGWGLGWPFRRKPPAQ